MGSLQYDGVVIEFPDRLLAHLQVVIVQKLQRNESFLMSWRDSMKVGDGRSSIWLNQTQHLFFKFSGSRTPSINPAWIDHLRASANSPRGLIVTNEYETTSEDVPVAQAQSVHRTNGLQYSKIDEEHPSPGA